MGEIKKALIVIMNYCSEKETIEYCNDIKAQKRFDELAVYVVDNKVSAGQEGVLSATLANNTNIKYIKAGENLGYLNGAFLGVKEFKEVNGYIPKWVAVSNTDIRFEHDFFDRFFSNEYDENIWCVGPSVLSKNGFSNPHYKIRVSLRKINRLIRIFENPVLSKVYFWLATKKTKHTVKEDSCFVYSNHGCFFFLRDKFFYALGDEKYGALLYSEESFIAEFILQNEKKSYYDSSFQLFHDENLVTGKINKTKKGKLISESLRYIRSRFYSEQ